MSKKVLIVDDDPVIRTLISDIISSFGHSVESYSDGAQCLDKIQQELPDVLILDLQMPGMSGLDVLNKIRADSRTAGLPVIMLSANSDAQDVSQNSAKADQYIQKPFNVADFIKALENSK